MTTNGLDAEPRQGWASRLPTWAKGAVGGGVALILIVAAFLIGAASNDESGTVSDLEERVGSVEQEVADAQSEIGGYEASIEEAEADKVAAEDELAAERGFKGADEAQQVADSSEFETDYPWGAVGEVENLSIKPISLEGGDGTFTLTIEAKNEGDGPVDPFCGLGSSILMDAEEREFSGETVLSYEGGGDNCGDALQPGLTGTYVEEFEMPPNAKPVLVYIAAEYGGEDGKTWAAP